MATSWFKWLKNGMFAIVFVIMVYLLAALAGSILPANQSWNSPDDGIELLVETNGLHTGIIMPIRTDVHDWTDLVRAEDMTDPRLYGSHILVGWGHAGVYRNTRYWRDLKVSDAASAIFGSDETLVHVYHLTYPQAYPHYRRSLKVSEAEYRKIAAVIRARFMLNDAGVPTPSRGYGKYDLFYQARGHYNAFYTCNSWTSDVLRQAGVRTGQWTPFQGGVMRWVPEKTKPAFQ